MPGTQVQRARINLNKLMLNTDNKILVVGSIAYDSVETSAGKNSEALGGSAAYFALSASYFSRPSIIAIVGSDFDKAHLNMFKSRNIDLTGLKIKDGKTFRWAGKYDPNNLNHRETISTDLNVFEDFMPNLKTEHKTSSILFLANIQPDLQMEVLKQTDTKPNIVAMDSMNIWIQHNKDDLLRLITKVDIIFLDESELRQLTGIHNIVDASKAITSLGPKVAVIKKGEYGLLMNSVNIDNSFSLFACPALPIDSVLDPTGAGDSFAGGFMGYLASTGKDLSKICSQDLRKAAIYGTIMGSFTVQGFSVDRLKLVTDDEIQGRYKDFEKLTTIS